mgnify:CR=1 FL=1
MNWTIILHTQTADVEYVIPFESGQTVYYTHKKKWWKKKSPWVITKTRVDGIWATGTYGVTLHTDEHLHESEFKYLFMDRDEAIDFCLKKNERNKVKIYGE